MLSIPQLEEQLNDFDPDPRLEALRELASLAARGEIAFPLPKPEVNIHIHSFFSFNALGWSPSRIAWEAKKYGLGVAGIVDFDVLDGLEEFHQAGESLGLKTVVGLETRVFVREYADRIITSPNEPGIHYFMVGAIANAECGMRNAECGTGGRGSVRASPGGRGGGCPERSRRVRAGPGGHDVLPKLLRVANERTKGVMERVNAHLPEIGVDYEQDVLPLTPAGNPTERHLLLAYDRKARQVFGGPAEFWAKALDISEPEARKLISNTPAFHEKIRAKLMKFGGVAYVPPDTGSFPTVEEVIAMSRSMGALPMTTWHDGTSKGESDMRANLELFVSRGVVAMNIVPERNWNIPDPDEKALKLTKLREAMEAARDFDLPISMGTEMNRAGQPFVDNFSAPELADYIPDFLRGAHFFYGHTLLARYADFGYFSVGAEAAFGGNRRAKNRFFEKVGEIARPSGGLCDRLKDRAGDLDPGRILEVLR